MTLLLLVCLLAVSPAASTPSDPHSTFEDAVYINTTTSSFVKIIKTSDVRSRDPIYSTPAVVMIGKDNGDILRCLQEDPNECEVFHKCSSTVYSLLITGEYLYAGLGTGGILRCQLNRKESCITFHTTASNVMSLSVVGGYLHAGFDGGNPILRCELNKSNSCRTLHTLQSPIYSLIRSEQHIYAGLWNGQIMRCSLRTENSCALLYTMDSGIMGFVNVGNSVMAVTRNGGLWNCSHKFDIGPDYCVSVTTGKSDLWDIASSNGLLYIVNKEGIYICKWANATNCYNYGLHKNAVSIAFAYSTYDMQGRYVNEHTSCTWQISHKCPPFVTYYEPHQRVALEIDVKEGKLRNSVGVLVDTTHANEGKLGPAGIFAMGPDGRLLLSNAHVGQLVHTSSLLAGSPVAGAGEMVVENGVIKKMNTCSDHYQPDLIHNAQVIEALRAQGYTDPIDSQSCCDKVECGQLSSNNN